MGLLSLTYSSAEDFCLFWICFINLFVSLSFPPLDSVGLPFCLCLRLCIVDLFVAKCGRGVSFTDWWTNCPGQSKQQKNGIQTFENVPSKGCILGLWRRLSCCQMISLDVMLVCDVISENYLAERCQMYALKMMMHGWHVTWGPSLSLKTKQHPHDDFELVHLWKNFKFFMKRTWKSER